MKLTKAGLKTILRMKINEEKQQLKISRAMERENAQRALGVGKMKNFERQWENDYEETSQKSRKPKNSRKKKMTKISLESTGIL